MNVSERVFHEQPTSDAFEFKAYDWDSQEGNQESQSSDESDERSERSESPEELAKSQTNVEPQSEDETVPQERFVSTSADRVESSETSVESQSVGSQVSEQVSDESNLNLDVEEPARDISDSESASLGELSDSQELKQELSSDVPGDPSRIVFIEQTDELETAEIIEQSYAKLSSRNVEVSSFNAEIGNVDASRPNIDRSEEAVVDDARGKEEIPQEISIPSVQTRNPLLLPGTERATPTIYSPYYSIDLSKVRRRTPKPVSSQPMVATGNAALCQNLEKRLSQVANSNGH